MRRRDRCSFPCSFNINRLWDCLGEVGSAVDCRKKLRASVRFSEQFLFELVPLPTNFCCSPSEQEKEYLEIFNHDVKRPGVWGCWEYGRQS